MSLEGVCTLDSKLRDQGGAGPREGSSIRLVRPATGLLLDLLGSSGLQVTGQSRARLQDRTVQTNQ